MTGPRSSPRLARSVAALAAAAVGLSLGLSPSGPAAAAPVECNITQEPVHVTATCVDSTYAKPVIDSEQDVTTPVNHHRVSGHFDGTNINGPNDLRNWIVSKYSNTFVQLTAEKLMTYALGRGLQPYDMPAVRKIVRDAAAANYRFSTLIMGIATSPPFQMKRVPDAETN